MAEIWKNIPSLPGYQASSDGRIRKGQTVLGVLSPCYSQEGYPRYSVKRKGKNISITGHILVCEAFHGKKPTEKHEVRHLDGSKNNNHPGNLKWGTRKENIKDQIAHGTSNHGERNGRAVLTRNIVEEIRDKYKNGTSGHKLLKQYKISKTQMYRIINFEQWVSASCEGTAK